MNAKSARASLPDRVDRTSDERDPTIRQSGTVPVMTLVPAWAWCCNECGWLGVGLTSETAALREASDHYWDEHNLALCKNLDGPGWGHRGHPGHRWKRLAATDGAEQCERCKEVSAK